MKQTISAPSYMVPTANIAVNKSRIKVYNNVGDLPTYYLQKGQEFQIELANPTTDVVLAKITLNGKELSGGGLVLNPGQRVWLDRYLDVAKKFLFDTYEVSNSKQMKEAIKNNGDIKIQFFREKSKLYNPIFINNGLNTVTLPINNYHNGTDPNFLRGSITPAVNQINFLQHINTINTAPYTLTSTNLNGGTTTYTSNFGSAESNASLNDVQCNASSNDLLGSFKDRMKPLRKSFSKTVETGRVEEGSHSDQTFRYVNKEFDYFAFHTIEYKILPVSQKINTVADVNIKRYCTNCGSKLGKTDKFCSNCGVKA